MKRMPIVLVAALCAALVSCRNTSGPDDMPLPICTAAEDLNLRTGNWWVYDTQVTGGEVAMYRDSMVVVGSVRFDGRDGHVLQIFRDGVVYDSVMISNTNGNCAVREGILQPFSYLKEVSTWFDVSLCDDDSVGHWQHTLAHDTVAVIHHGEVIPCIVTIGATGRSTSYDSIVGLATGTYPVRLLNMVFTTTESLEPPAGVVFEDSTDQRSVRVVVKVGIRKGVGIAYWQQVPLYEADSLSIRTTTTRRLVAWNVR